MSLKPGSEQSHLNWFALRVRSKHEKRVADVMSFTGFECLVPVQRVRRRWSQRWKELELPLFPGYVFSRFGREDWTCVVNLPGVVDAVRVGKKLAALDEEELRSLRVAESSHCDLEPCAYLPMGQRIQIVEGPLAGLSGIVADDQGRSQLILSVTLLQRSVRVKIERDALEVARPAA